MKRSWSIIAAYVLCVSGGAQNLVPNGSFEERDTCAGPGVGYAMYATGWMNLHTQSADYFNACNSGGVVDVPYSQFGYQYPADGDAYVGMATAFPGLDWYREMVGIELTEPLQPGVPVCLSFKMAVGGFGSWSGNSSFRTSKGVGLKFFTQLPTDWQSYLYPNSAALFLDEVPTDTSQWYAVSGTYTPDSAYTYLVVGNFFADSLSGVTILDSTGFGTFEASYAFIDDVRASFTLSYCTQEAGVGEVGREALMAYPVPCADVLRVRIREGAQRPLHYSLRDMAGREVVHGLPAPDAGEFTINTQHLPGGVYVLQLITTQGSLPPLAVIHVSP
ncbi:MAG: T9SS type A sorting domain-containing protein [Flavobacteriales bacterium]|nr:T9SS type A sorting domain-containing protein [Flavobacteriales bacterium]